MSNFVTTNIRIPEEDYVRLKEEAFKKRKSFSAVIRDKISSPNNRSEAEIKMFLKKRDQVAKKLHKKLKDVDIVKVLREMRYEEKW